MEVSEGYLPVARSDARILILGSLPGVRSIEAQEYYAHPRNAFWPIMEELFDVRGHYAERCQQIQENGIALWDVLRASVRPGSLDANIRTDTARLNDFERFLQTHPKLELIAFNGKKAEQLFRRRVPNTLFAHIRTRGLPSTSPAYAAMNFMAKLGAWRSALFVTVGVKT